MFTLVILVLLLTLVIGHGYVAPLFTPRGRKFLYGGAILLLFFAMLFHRGEVEAAADEHSLRETNIGKVDLGGSTARFALASFRGPLICLLWWDATELQTKHEFQELEMRYQSLTKLQPHFRSPWIYQAWNLAYNVSVEFDRVEEKYFWISQGIRRLAEGEEVNRSWIHDPRVPGGRKEIGDPDVRWYVGFMLQDKFSVSDEVNTHRCFLHLSCTPPDQWDPARLRQSAEQYETFIKGHPQLVRQIRLLRNIPEGADRQLKDELLAFFAAHRRLPSLYPPELQLRGQSSAQLDPAALRRFPVWPEKRWPANPELEDSHDPHDIAKEWYIFSNEPLPPPALDIYEVPEEARFYRLPQRMMSIIFRKQPAQAKAHQGMQLGKDGWFEQSQNAWKKALEMWLAFGAANKMEMRDFDEMQVRDRRYQVRFPEEASTGQPPPRLYRDNAETMADYRAFMDMRFFEERRRHANYVHWKTVSETNSTDAATEARRHIYTANANRSDFRLALSEYELGLKGWKQLLVAKRPIDPQRDAAFLLALGPNSGMLLSLTAQPQELFVRTSFGDDTIVNDELVEMQDQYVRLRARALGGNTVQAAQAIWQMSSVVSLQLAGNAGAGALMGTGLSPITMAFAEKSQQHFVAPLDLYFLPGYAFKSFRFNLPKRMPPSDASSDPSPGAPGK